MKIPANSEYPAYYESYISLVKDENVIKLLGNRILTMQSLVSDIPEEKEEFSYAPGKWTLKEVIGHIIDTERIMSYRALCIARGETKELPGFDENQYVANAFFNKLSLYDLAHEFGVVRESSLTLFKNFDDTILGKKGIANGKEMSVRALIYMIAGHEIHHFNVINAKYL